LLTGCAEAGNRLPHAAARDPSEGERSGAEASLGAREVRRAGPVTPPAKVVVIAPARFRIQFTASAEREEMIQRARARLAVGGAGRLTGWCEGPICPQVEPRSGPG